MTDEQYKQLALLVTYLLESGDWKTVWINEYAEPIKLFIFRTGITYRRVKKYVHKALLKLLGEKYELTQRRLAAKCCGHDDLLFKPKTMTQKLIEEQLKNVKQISRIGEKHTPSTEFGKKYREHYGCTAIENRAQYIREKRLYNKTGKASWE